MERRKIIFAWACFAVMWPVAVVTGLQSHWGWVSIPFLMLFQIGTLHHIYRYERKAAD